MLAIQDAFKAGLLNKNNWWQNILAGIIVGVVALPLAMAFAIAIGAKPEQGLYTAIIAALFVAIFGGSRVQIAGPTGAFIVILADITARHGMIGLQIATLMAGVILIVMGLLRLGNVIKFIPDPVIVGFTAGIGAIIFVGQWKDFFGLSLQTSLNAHFHEKLFAAIKAFPALNFSTTALALLSLTLVLGTPKISKRLPGPLVAMLVATMLQMIFKFDQVATIGSLFGGIPQTLPHFAWPEMSFHTLLALLGPAFTIALLGAIESLLSATAADGMAGTRHHSNQELIGQGLANMVAPLFGGFAATGAIARTATNVRNGGNSPLSAIVHSVFLLLVIVLLAPLAAYVPLCTLAAILFVVSYNMSDVPHFIHIVKHAPWQDVAILLTTFFLTVFTDLVIAVNVGVILAMVFFVYRMTQSVEVKAHSADALSSIKLPADTLVYTIQGPFFFGAAEKIERALAITHTDPKNIIFRLHEVPFMDMTGLQTFAELIEQYHKRHVKIWVTEANKDIKAKLIELNITAYLEGNGIESSLEDAVKQISIEDENDITLTHGLKHE